MSLYEICKEFWKENEKHRFSPSEITLFFFILNECNKQYWQMPISCSTEYICSKIGITKTTICRARRKLARSGFIEYSKGKWGTKTPQYTICLLGNVVTIDVTNGVTNDVTINKDKDKDKDRESDYIARPEKSGKVIFPIPELRKRLMGDTMWHDKVLLLLSEEGLRIDKPTLIALLGQFFLMLETNGPEGKELSDCKHHAYNWIRRKLKEGNYGNKQHDDRRRAVEVIDCSPEDYEGSF